MSTDPERRELGGNLPEENSGRSFDPLASVNMMRFDITNYGHVLPETRNQIYDEEMTYIAEGIDRHSYTQFTLQHDPEKGLVYFAKGEWRPYVGTLLTGLDVAEREAEADPRRQFLVDWAVKDLRRGLSFEKLTVGESSVWYSAFAEAECQRYGEEFIASVGLNPKRRMGFIYKATRQEDGSVVLESHTVDNSDQDAFDAVSQLPQDALMSELINAYDQVLMQKNSGTIYRAGRTTFLDRQEENAWDFVERNQLLFDYYFDEIEKLARSKAWGDELETAKKRLTYGVWARTRQLLDEQDSSLVGNSVLTHQTSDQIAAQVHQAYLEFSRRHETMIGCGGAISFEDMPADAVFDSIFGKKSEVLSWHGGKIKKAKCVNCKEGPKDVGVESWCHDCISGHCGSK